MSQSDNSAAFPKQRLTAFVLTLLALVSIAIFSGGQANAQDGEKAPAEASKVAVIDLQRVLEKDAVLEEEINALKVKAREAEQLLEETYVSRLTKMEDEIAGLNRLTAKWISAKAEYFKVYDKFLEDKAKAEDRFTREKDLAVSDAITRILRVIRTMASERGFDTVMNAPYFSKVSNDELTDVSRLVAATTVVYVSHPSRDLTDDVIAQIAKK